MALPARPRRRRDDTVDKEIFEDLEASYLFASDIVDVHLADIRELVSAVVAP